MLTSASVIGSALSPPLSRFAAAADRSAIAPEMTPKDALSFSRSKVDRISPRGESIARGKQQQGDRRYSRNVHASRALPMRQAGTLASGYCHLSGVPPRLPAHNRCLLSRMCADETWRGMVEVDRRVGVDEIVSCVDV